ncbi:SGNH/GDSL hydrolase family protein [Aporhodopirellula aestuarii]|uniref:SGNH/GDSL hydrolase family protein n=1 Tax=Aporhodopirellula aestuarii TaxID=2950107 RepID=A0ABT0U6F8_9BACT|nr:SGNH/GDSL hydrolase family protein [Aporhodopirellula aestuarii]MCM2372509.1 SGNH/GDSL hydrolase family protein [Aporhodopirellula aestuarii]
MFGSSRLTRGTIVRWALGPVFGTLIVWATSPWFMRSYHSRVFDPVCEAWVYPLSTHYRWRSEGYATTTIGRHGMPGRTELPPPTTKTIVALWGDSQAEGVCVDDRQKLWSQLERRLTELPGNTLAVLPMGRSGEDAADWTGRFKSTEQHLGVTKHVVLVCELNDLSPLTHLPPESLDGTLAVSSDAALMDWIPDFVVHAARGLLMESSSNRVRRLRFGVGPVTMAIANTARPAGAEATGLPVFPAAEIASQLHQATTKPLTIIYAPNLPVVMGGEIRRNDDHADEFASLAIELERRGIEVIDCRESFAQSADQGRFPHGFHNGHIGSGHLNTTGYQLITDAVAEQSN